MSSTPDIVTAPPTTTTTTTTTITTTITKNLSNDVEGLLETPPPFADETAELLKNLGLSKGTDDGNKSDKQMEMDAISETEALQASF